MTEEELERLPWNAREVVRAEPGTAVFVVWHNHYPSPIQNYGILTLVKIAAGPEWLYATEPSNPGRIYRPQLVVCPLEDAFLSESIAQAHLRDLEKRYSQPLPLTTQES